MSKAVRKAKSRALNGPRMARKTARIATPDERAEIAIAAVKKAYATVEAVRQPLEGAHAVLDLLMENCEGADRETGVFTADPGTVYMALNLVRKHVREAREAATRDGDELMRACGVLAGRREP